MSAGFLWLAVSTGLLSVLTPCVFPMVPITIAYFSEPGERKSALRKAFLFALGIIGTFTALGLALAAIFGAAGLNRFAADWRVNLALALLFLLFAANLFGWVELRLPSRLVNTADRAVRGAAGQSTAGPLLMGATFTLTSLTCTAPFVGTLLVLASQGSWRTPLVGMLVYSTAFAMPFFFLALAPRLLSRLPRAGEWMRTLRLMIGILEVGAAIKFISNTDMVLQWGVFTREVVLLSWSALAFAAVVYLAGDVIPAMRAGRWKQPRLIPIAGALMVTAWLASGATGRTLKSVEAFLPPADVPGEVASASAAAPVWMLNDYPGALAQARTSGKFVLVDFTGYTCTNCRWMEANIFSRPDVEAELGQFVLSRLYTDGDGDMYERQQAFQETTFGTVALPLYAVVDSEGKVRATFSGLTRNAAEFIAFLQRAREPRVATLQEKFGP